MISLKERLKKYPNLYEGLKDSKNFLRQLSLSPRKAIAALRERRLKRELSSLGGSAYFIQVGSNDGKSGDPIFEIARKNRWRGIVIEPVPHLYAKLQHNYCDADGIECLNLAIAPEGSNLTFYTVPDNIENLLGQELPFWADQLSSFKKENLEKHLGGILAPHIIELDVKCATLRKIVNERNIRNIDLLHIDAEGFDYEVFQTFPFPEILPKIIILEHKHMANDLLRILLSRLESYGYQNFLLNSDLLAVKNK